MKAFVTRALAVQQQLGSCIGGTRRQGQHVRPEKARKSLGGLDIDIVEGDMENVSAFADAPEGCDVVFHTAAYFREYYAPGDHAAKIDRINVDGTIALLDAAKARGVRRAVDTSSSGTGHSKPKWCTGR
ncbi:MAG: NAD(P)H-binding protein [Polyangiaceae bacterium]